ncbi:UBP9-binding protein [Podosphaera aphanis]|nr:UBP9-binding protein [Podosphaera aphanis]
MVNKRARQRVSYVLPLSNSSSGHRLGVNGLAVDTDNSILYSGGRDGAICAWKLKTNSKASKKATSTAFHAQIEAHTHWVNDILLADNNSALVSASSDLTVKVWRPDSTYHDLPQTIGQHTDYVKCLATPRSQTEWVASGGLDRKICVWDLSGAGNKLEIEVRDEEKIDKGSVYALATNHSILASGGPESVIRLWDPRTGKRITKLVGHTDNIRDILITEAGDIIMTASSDQTIKIWSVTACRCMYTLTMHNDSVWSLYSDDPSLCTFYSSDRSGLVVKTSTQGYHSEIHNGIALAVAQENDGVNKVIAGGDYIWTATSSSSINRWASVDMEDFQLSSDAHRHYHSSVPELLCATNGGRVKHEISTQSILRITNTSSLPAAFDPNGTSNLLPLSGARKPSAIVDSDIEMIVPIRASSEETIEGQHGLVKHKLLNDRKRVLTIDTAGEIILWDLLQCTPIKSFGKRHLEDVEPEVNTIEAIAPWCSINTRTGRLAVDLEEHNCFDAEMYADELQLDEGIEFREDQRINLGKWILRHLFSNLVDEIVKRDEIFRKNFARSISSSNSGSSIVTKVSSSSETEYLDASNEVFEAALVQLYHSSGDLRGEVNPDTRDSRASIDSGDNCTYISNLNESSGAIVGEIRESEGSSSALNGLDKEYSKEGNTFFGKNFKKGMSLCTKKNLPVSNIGKSASMDEKMVDSSEASDGGEKEPKLNDCFGGVLREIRTQYRKNFEENPSQPLESGITPSPPNETPTLKLPPLTTVIIQEETSGGNVDLYRGTVASVGKDARLIEERAPTWLGELLLRNQIPHEVTVKVSFILQPWRNLLPNISGTDGNSRLNANRMLRVKKILAYVAEHIEPPCDSSDFSKMKPEDYLELYCNDQKLPVTMTLATLRAHVWKGGADVMLFYKSNGRKPISTEKVLVS